MNVLSDVRTVVVSDTPVVEVAVDDGEVLAVERVVVTHPQVAGHKSSAS